MFCDVLEHDTPGVIWRLMWSVIESADSQRFVWCQLVLGTVKTPCSIVTRDPAAAATDAQSAITRHVPPIFELSCVRG